MCKREIGAAMSVRHIVDHIPLHLCLISRTKEKCGTIKLFPFSRSKTEM